MIRMRKGPEEEKKAGAEEVTDAAAGAAAPAAARGRGARIFGIARGRRAAEAPSAAKAPTSAGELRVQKGACGLGGSAHGRTASHTPTSPWISAVGAAAPAQTSKTWTVALWPRWNSPILTT